MISNQILQDTIDGIKAITRIDLCVMDTEGKPLASTLDAVEEYKEAVLVFAESLAESQALQGYQFFKVFDENQLEYIILVKGETDDVYMVGKMAAFQVQNLLIAYKERFDKDNFIKNLLLDNLLLVDIYNRAKKLHIETEVRRCVFIVETKNDRDNNAFETVRNIFSAKTRDFITAVDEKNIILVKEVKNGEGYDELTKTAQVIVDMLNTEAMTKVHVAFGTIVNEIKEVSRSYKEAKMAMYVGKIFYPDKNVIAYSRLGIGRLIYQLPLPLCKMFIKEIFDGRSPDEFDEETLQTIKMVTEQNDRLGKMVKTLLDMSELQTVGRDEKIILNDLVDEVLEDLEPLAQEKNIKLIGKYKNITMIGSDILIYRLVYNLVENAIKYNHSDGQVTVNAYKKQKHIYLSVEDTGSGIPKELRERVFEPFFRVDKSRSRELGGVGLGLALVHEIVRVHDGSISIKSNPAGGTIFEVIFDQKSKE